MHHTTSSNQRPPELKFELIDFEISPTWQRFYFKNGLTLFDGPPPPAKWPEPPELEALRAENIYLLEQNRIKQRTIDMLLAAQRPKGPQFKGVPLDGR